MLSSKNINARQRLIKDLARVEKEEDSGIYASPDEDNILQWEAIIFGPESSVWEGGVFKLQLTFTEDYPSKPPNIKFISTVFHPNGKLNLYNQFTLMVESALTFQTRTGHPFMMF